MRKALLSDVKPLLKLINDYASQGIMLPRTEFELAENIRDFTVAVLAAKWPAAAHCTSTGRGRGKFAPSPFIPNESTSASASA